MQIHPSNVVFFQRPILARADKTRQFPSKYDLMNYLCQISFHKMFNWSLFSDFEALQPTGGYSAKLFKVGLRSMAELIRILAPFAESEKDSDSNIRRLLGVISRMGMLTPTECHLILKENDISTRWEKFFQTLALQDEPHCIEILRAICRHSSSTSLTDESLYKNTDENLTEQLLSCFIQHNKIDRRGKFPLKGLNLRFQRSEQQQLYESVFHLFHVKSAEERILWLIGGAGLGTTTLATRIVYDSKFLSEHCNVVQVIWLDMQQIPTSNTINAIVRELARLLLPPDEIETLLYDELEPDSPSSILLTQSLINKINDLISNSICTLSHQSILLVVDSVTNCNSLSQLMLGKLNKAVRCIAILNDKVDSLGSCYDAAARSVVVSKLPEKDLLELFARNIPEKEAQRLAMVCDGSPLISSLIQSKLQSDPLSINELLKNIEKTNLSKFTPETIANFLLNSVLDGNLFWRSFLLFEPGECVDIDDLMLIWKVGRCEAERYCREFCEKCLIRPLLEGKEINSAEIDGMKRHFKYFCVHSTVYEATLRLAASRQQLSFDSSKKSEMRFAIICAAFIADSGNICLTFHEALRLARRHLIEKIISIVESVEYLWKFSDCQLIILNLTDYFFHNAFGFVLEEQNPANESPIFENHWLRLHSRFINTLAKDERRTQAIAKSLSSICGRSKVAESFICQTFVYAAAYNGFEIISLLLEHETMAHYRNSLLSCKEPRLGRDALHMAASHGYTSIVRLLLDHGASVLSRDATFKLALTLSLEHGHLETTALLLEPVISKVKTEGKMTSENFLAPLISACLSGYEAVTRFVLENRGSSIDVNTLDDHRRTALMAAVWSNSVGVAKMIIEAGADVSAQDEFGKSALSRAVEAGNPEMVQLLLRHGADVNIRELNGRTAPITAVGTPNFHDEILKGLIEHKSNLMLVDKHGRTVLHIAAWENRLSAVELIINNCEALVNKQDNFGASPLLAAAKRGNAAVVKLLLQRGAKVDVADNAVQTALMQAAEGGHADVCKVLIEANANIDAVDTRAMTSLHLAVENGQSSVVSLLLECKANVTLTDSRGSSVLMSSVECGFIGISKDLIGTEHSERLIQIQDLKGQNALMLASYRGDVLSASLLLETGKVDVDTADNDGITALMAAVKNGHLAVAQLLIEKGADVEKQSKAGLNALLFSASFGYPILCRYLLTHCGTNVNVRDVRNFTPLMIAAKNGFANVCKILLDNRADVTAKDDNDRTALMRASTNGHSAIVELILKYVDPSQKQQLLQAVDKRGKTCLTKAAEQGQPITFRALLDAAGVNENLNTALFGAASNGHVEIIRTFVEKYPDYLKTNPKLATDILNEALQNRQEPVAKFLLSSNLVDDSCSIKK